jgi:soluble lytic murein transglycosylase-like protein
MRTGRPPVSIAVLVVASALVLAGPLACGDEANSQELPTDPPRLAAGIEAADASWRAELPDWLAAGRPQRVPERMAAAAGYLQRAASALSRDQKLAAQTLGDLPPRVRKQTRDTTRAIRDLHRLSAGSPPAELQTGPPTSLDVLLPAYRAGKQRFNIGTDVLAAVNHVESAFGQARNDSGAGAKGPMQFIPSTWKIYGLGGNIKDPHDAILGAANYLHQSGAPGSYRDALFAYNRSRLYVDAVLSYARLIRRDREALYLLYSWKPG